MNDAALLQLLAVVVGGILATAGGILSTIFIENQKRKQESAHLAMAFKGEIRALVQHVHERNYLARIADVISQMKATGEPFFMPLRIRFHYDRVYENNVERIGLLKSPLPERIPLFYTRMYSVLEDFSNLGDRVYTDLEITTLIRVYEDLHRILRLTIEEGTGIIQEIDAVYGLA